MGKPLSVKKEWKVPHVYAIMIVLLIFVGILTYIVPAGVYERVTVDGITKVDPASFHYVEQTPVGFVDWFTSIPKGFVQSALVVATLLVGAAFFGIYTESGVFQKYISILLRNSQGKVSMGLMLLFMVFFTLKSGFTGAIEGHLVFVPLTVGFALAAGYDVMTGVALTLVPTFIAFTFGPANPYTILISQNIAGLPPYSGFAFRTILFVIVSVITFHHIIAYATRVKKDKSKSLVADVDVSDLYIEPSSADEKMTGRENALMIMLLLTVVAMVVMSVGFGWGLNEIIAILIISGIAAGFVAGYSIDKMADMVNKTGQLFYMAGFLVAISRAVYVILADGNILDTIVYAMAGPLSHVGGAFSSVLLMAMTAIFDFFVGSGSGKAAIIIPIMSPLANILNITQQTVVLAYQIGDGLTNMIWPTSGILFAYLAMGKVEYPKFLRYIMPLIAKLFAVSIIAIIIAYYTGYGPF